MRTATHENSGNTNSNCLSLSFNNMCCASHAQQEAQQNVRDLGQRPAASVTALEDSWLARLHQDVPHTTAGTGSPSPLHGRASLTDAMVRELTARRVRGATFRLDRKG